MESEFFPRLASVELKRCQCNRCSLSMKKSFSATSLVSASEESPVGTASPACPGLPLPQSNARADLGNDCTELSETITRQLHIIQNLVSELEKERSASSSAANEALSMILRLQRDKAEIQMEARQFKTFAEEKLAHDQEEIVELEELVHKKDEAIEALTCGLSEADAEGKFVFPPEIYPDGDHEIHAIEKYAFGETPLSEDELRDLEFRISQLERSHRTILPDCEYFSTKDVPEMVIVGESPRTPTRLRKFPIDSTNPPVAMGKEMWPDLVTDSPQFSSSFKNKRKMDNASEAGEVLIDRICMVDSVYQGASINGHKGSTASIGIGKDEYMAVPKGSPTHCDSRDLEIQKLYLRLRALEADRELMRQAVMSMGTDKAQMTFLKELAQNWCREITPERTTMPRKKQSAAEIFLPISILKWIFSFVFFWRRRTHGCKYTFGLSENNIGLLLVLDRSPVAVQLKCTPHKLVKATTHK